MNVQEKRVIVLGGTAGIGLATAQAAARAGARVVVASSSEKRVTRALAALPPGSEGKVVDLSREESVRAFFDGVGAFDHLVFTAGDSLRVETLATVDLTSARRFFELRYWGALTAAKYGARHLRAGGSIVFTGGVAAERPMSGWSLGASICGAMESLTRALAVELAPIRVNLVSPGFVRTELWNSMGEAERAALYRDVAAKLPVGRVGEAADIAEAYVYLMGNGYSTGQTIVVDGGGTLV
jgi:NAD(P)-dependent dehydrogenase (short-subunit alcohol dehydrogenase family)